MKTLAKIVIVFGIVLFVFQSCEKDDSHHGISAADSVYYAVDEIMHYWYLWNDSVPDVEYLSYNSPQDLMNDLVVSLDRWSFVDKESTVSSLFEEGEDFGFGFFLGWDSQSPLPTTNLRVIFAYNNTDAFEAGIRRGCIIKEIDDKPVMELSQSDFDNFFDGNDRTMKFKFIDNNSVEHTTTLSKKKYNMNAVFYANTYNVSGKTAGYMVYQSFLGYSKIELEETIDFFKDAGITELIIDLRYNGGGYVSLAEEMANIIIPSSVVGETYFTKKYNKDRSNENDTIVKFQSVSRNLNLDRVFFITNQYSASASELVINGLDPHMNVVTIGNTTYGKPVGMDGFLFQDWLIYPVTAQSFNSEGFGNYFDGLTPDKQVDDKYKNDWGDETEPALSQAFYYISHGTFDPAVSIFKTTDEAKLVNDVKFITRNFMLMDR
jgi:carboxyl-terminal processing protease